MYTDNALCSKCEHEYVTDIDLKIFMLYNILTAVVM